MRKSQFLARLRDGRETWEQAFNYVGISRYGIGAVSGHWSARDILAHLIAREIYMLDRLREILEGSALPACQTQDELDTFLEEFGYPDFESPMLQEQVANEWAILKYREIPFQDLIDSEMRVFEDLHETITTLSEQQLNEDQLAERLAKFTYKHYRQHTADIYRRFKAPLKR